MLLVRAIAPIHHSHIPLSCGAIVLDHDYRAWYARFLNEPAGPRGLINEFMSYMLLQHLGLPIPLFALIHVPLTLLKASPTLIVRTASGPRPCAAGLNFGIHYDTPYPNETALGYLPDILHWDLANLRAFPGMVAFDKWVCTRGERRVAFPRSLSDRWTDPDFRICNSHGRRRKWARVATMVHHERAFGGTDWQFIDEPTNGLYRYHLVYHNVTNFDAFNPWLDRIAEVSPEVFDCILRCIPRSWLKSSFSDLERLCETLYARRNHVPDLIRRCKNATVDPFPHWR